MLRGTMLFGKSSMRMARKCQTTAVLLLLPSCIHLATDEETVILEENAM